eukprot:1348446-Pleurochrysis_carterae.AAC.5
MSGGRHRPNLATEGLASSANFATRALRQYDTSFGKSAGSALAAVLMHRNSALQLLNVLSNGYNFSWPSSFRVAKSGQCLPSMHRE